MPGKTLITALVITCLLIGACQKDDPPVQQPDNPTLADSVALLKGKWIVIKDSSTNMGNYFFMEGGTAYYPNPGVYTGVAADYWEFSNKDTLTAHENNQTYKSKYQLLADNKIIIQDLQVHGTGKVIALTMFTATFDWSNTSPNGGQYFRRVYLKR